MSKRNKHKRILKLNITPKKWSKLNLTKCITMIFVSILMNQISLLTIMNQLVMNNPKINLKNQLN